MIVTAVWLSAAVEKIWLFLVGIVVLRSMSLVMTPPSVSMPSESGVTSRRSTSFTDWSPVRIARLYRGADGDHFVRVHALVRHFAENLFDFALHRRHAGRAADEHDLVDLARGKFAILDRLAARLDAPVDQVLHERFEFCAGERHVEVLGTARVGGNERQIDVCLHRRRKFDLRLFRGLFEPLERHAVVAQVDAVCLLELFGDMVHDHLVEIVAAEVGVAVRGFHFKHPFADFQNGDVERSAAEVEHRDLFVALLFEAVGERGSGRFVDDALDIKAGDAARVFCGLALGVVEIGRAP